MSAANNSLKNNRNLLKRKGKGALSGSYSNIELGEFPKTTPEQLLELKKKIKKENKQARTKQILIYIVFILSLIVFFFYLTH